MATLADLDNLTNDPTTVNQWLNQFTTEERDTILTAIDTHPPTKVWNILANLDEHPFPFGVNTLVAWKHRNQPRGAA